MIVFRVLRSNLLETVAKRCASTLPLVSHQPLTSTPHDSLRRRNDQCVLPLAAQQRCHQHTVASLAKDEMSTWEKFKWDLGFYGKLRVPKRYLHVSGFNLYVSCTDLIDFPEFVRELNIPDTFTSWFLVLQLHLWLLHVKLSQMGKEGLLLTQHVYRNMWSDVERRLNTFQELLGSEKAASMRQFHSLMCSSILYYDEGLVGSDQHLTNALWLQLFSMDQDVPVRNLELMVEYVRKQAHHLDKMSDNLVMQPGYINFLPLLGTELEAGKVEKDLAYLQSVKYK